MSDNIIIVSSKAMAVLIKRAISDMGDDSDELTFQAENQKLMIFTRPHEALTISGEAKYAFKVTVNKRSWAKLLKILLILEDQPITLNFQADRIGFAYAEV